MQQAEYRLFSIFFVPFIIRHYLANEPGAMLLVRWSTHTVNTCTTYYIHYNFDFNIYLFCHMMSLFHVAMPILINFPESHSTSVDYTYIVLVHTSVSCHRRLCYTIHIHRYVSFIPYLSLSLSLFIRLVAEKSNRRMCYF